MNTPPEEIEFKIGPYRVIRHLAQGGTGAVYEVEDPSKPGRYALKLSATDGNDDAKMFEAHKVLSGIPHAGIVSSHATGTRRSGHSTCPSLGPGQWR